MNCPKVKVLGLFTFILLSVGISYVYDELTTPGKVVSYDKDSSSQTQVQPISRKFGLKTITRDRFIEDPDQTSAVQYQRTPSRGHGQNTTENIYKGAKPSSDAEQKGTIGDKYINLNLFIDRTENASNEIRRDGEIDMDKQQANLYEYNISDQTENTINKNRRKWRIDVGRQQAHVYGYNISDQQADNINEQFGATIAIDESVVTDGTRKHHTGHSNITLQLLALDNMKSDDDEIESKKVRKLNVLMIISDDLRPQLNAYRGTTHPNPFSDIMMHTPNLDSLSRRSLVLRRAYCQYAVCGPSRTSFLTGRRPDTTNVWNLSTYWRETGRNFTTIPQFYKSEGYISTGLGKVFHPGPMSGYDDPLSWTEPYYRPYGKHERYWQKLERSWVAAKPDERADHPLYDQEVTQEAVRQLHIYAPNATSGIKPFFMAVGYKKPHLPFICAEEAFKFYPLDSLEAVNNSHFPTGTSTVGWWPPEAGNYADMRHHNCSRQTRNDGLCELPESAVRLLRRAYFACVSYIDAEVGQLLDALQQTGLEESTIIVFLGDHGYHLGENGMFGKHSNFEQSTHVPLMLHIPGQTDHGLVSDSFVELIDLFPTLVQASGLGTVPQCPFDSISTTLCTEGTSFLPLIHNVTAELKQSAMAQIFRKNSMGYTLRTERFRYTSWTNFTTPGMSADWIWNHTTTTELYDHETDPEENVNLSNNIRYENQELHLRNMMRDSVNLDLHRERLDTFFSYYRR